jgi:LacI family transcriptional regulator
MPVVLFDRHLPGVKTDVIEVDNLFSTYNATRHLMDQGFKNIAFVTFASHQTQMMDRVKGYQDAMKSDGLKPTIVKEIVFNQDEEQIMAPLRDFFKGNPDVDAILFGTNHIGTCGLKIMHEMGLKAPTDIAVISFDDYDVFKLHSPPITAIAQPVEEIADNVITVLLDKLNDRSSSPKLQSIILKTDLKIRNSSLKNAI